MPWITFPSCTGLGQALSSNFKDIFVKCVKPALGDKAIEIRVYAAACASSIVAESNWIQVNELETVTSLALKSLEGSNYKLRTVTAQLLGGLMASCQDDDTWRNIKASKRPSNDDIAAMLTTAFIRGGSADMLNKTAASREARVGVSQAYVAYYTRMGPNWVEKNVSKLLENLLKLLTQPKILAASKRDQLCARKCILYIIINVLGQSQGEKGRTDTVSGLSTRLTAALASSQGTGKDKDTYEHLIVCALKAMAGLIEIIGSPIALMYETVMAPLLEAGVHSNLSIRVSAAHTLRSLGDTVPNKASFLANQCLDRIKKFRTDAKAIHGTGYALSAVLGSSASSSLGLPHDLAASVLALGEDFVKTKSTDKKTQDSTLAAIEVGWALIGSLTSLGAAAVDPHLGRISALWRATFPEKLAPLKAKDTNGWRQIIEGRAGSLSSMSGFLTDCKELATMDLVQDIANCLNYAVMQLKEIPTTKANSQLAACSTKMRSRLYVDDKL